MSKKKQTKKRYIQVTFSGDGYVATIEFAVTELKTLFEAGEVGDSLEFKVVEMAEEEFKSKPEFGGW